MHNNFIEAYDWEQIPNGTIFVDGSLKVTLLKVDGEHVYCDGLSNDSVMADVRKHTTSNGDEYYYFSLSEDDWNPILPKYFKILS